MRLTLADRAADRRRPLLVYHRPVYWYIPGVPEDKASEIATGMRRPEGTIAYRGSYPGLLAPDAPAEVLFEVVTGAQVFILRRHADLTLEFLYASPGVGTYTAAADLRCLTTAVPCDRFCFTLKWAPTGNGLYVGREDGGELVQAEGTRAAFTLAVGTDGTVATIGSEGVQVMAARMYKRGVRVFGPPAIAVWEETQTAAETLLQGTSDVDFLYEVVTTNAVVASLVTGFEVYGQERFAELEHEGVSADVGALVRTFLSREEQDQYDRGDEVAVLLEANQHDVPVAELLTTRINFQNYNDSKRAFANGYGVRFGDLKGVSSQLLERLQRFIRYRHRIIHVSPMLGMLNGPETPQEEPVFANRATAELAIETFATFVHALHAATLRLRA